jgi:glycosyltransferase involved in cell wall biosynthesis
MDGVNVHRIQSRTVNEKGLLTYAYRILRFLIRSTLVLRRMHREHRYDLIHVHNVPDFLVLAAIFPKWSAVPVILDIHDLLPELYGSKFKVSNDSFLFKVLTFVERRSAAFATHVIIANHLWRDRLAARSATPEKCSVVRNHPDLNIFVAQSAPDRKKNGRFVVIYPGTLNWHQGLDVAIRAFARVADRIPDADFHIYGEGSAKNSLIELANQLGMQDRITFHGFLPSREIARVMAQADLAIEPKRATSAFGNEALSTKILEFMVLGVPVIASRTRTHMLYYDDSIVKYYDNDDEVELADAVRLLGSDPMLRREQAARAAKYASENTWQARKEEYLQLVETLVSSNGSTTVSKQTAAGEPDQAFCNKA